MYTNAKLLLPIICTALIYWCNSCVTHTPEVLCMATTQQLISYKSRVLFSFFSLLPSDWSTFALNKYQNEAWSHWPMAWQRYITNNVGNPLIPLFISGTVLLIIVVRGTDRCCCLGKSWTKVLEIWQDKPVKFLIEFWMHLWCGSLWGPCSV